jgi:hypothetical protein
MERFYTLPYENMYPNIPQMYISPAQSKYHNLGMNAFVPPYAVYPGKRPGMVGDYGPVQQGCTSIPTYPYPLDNDPIRPYSSVCNGVYL